MFRSVRRPTPLTVPAIILLLTACTAPPGEQEQAGDLSVSLISQWSEVKIQRPQAPANLPALAEIRFDGGGQEGISWESMSGIEGLAVHDGALVGRTTQRASAIRFTASNNLGVGEELWAVEIRLRVSGGKQVAVLPLLAEGGPPPPMFLSGILANWPIASPLLPDTQTTTYSIELNKVPVLEMPMATGDFSNFLVRPTDAVGAEFAIDSIRFIFRSEYLETIPSGPGWHGLADVYRETLVSRAPEALSFQVDLPPAPWLDLAVGSVGSELPSFSVSVRDDSGAFEEVMKVKPEQSDAWEVVRVDLGPWAGQSIELKFEAEGTNPGALLFWGGATIRNSVALSAATRPQAVGLYLTDTLRRDHLEAWGYERDTAPHLARLANEGVRFEDAIAQSTWTKASIPSILTSLYPSTSGVTDLTDRVSAGETTLAEIFRAAGYATFATSSVPFTGQLTNLHQGVEVMYEYGASGATEGPYRSKTSKIWVDEYLKWLELHRDVPTFALIHVMDPHSPFEPPAPYSTLWSTEQDSAMFAVQAEALVPHIADPMLRSFLMPSREELAAAGVEEESFLAREKAWYDGSIRHMDSNLGRLLERLETLGLEDSALLAIVSDHGEEFLEHGNHWHGLTVYGEVTNVPLIFWGRGVPSGVSVQETVQTIDLLPTLADLAGLKTPERAQGRSLVPLFSGTAGHRQLPAFTERQARRLDGPQAYSMFSTVDDGWKLVWNDGAPDGVAEFELFDHRQDPLNQRDVAPSYPEIVARLGAKIKHFKTWAEQQKLDEEAVQSELSAEELEQLRSLGYVD